METLKKILTFLKNFVLGSFYPGLAAGFMLLFAAALFYIQPLDFLSDAALFPRNPHRFEVQIALRALKLGAALAMTCGLLIWLPPKLSVWWKNRPKKETAA